MNSDDIDTLPEGLPPEHRGNLLQVQALRTTRPAARGAAGALRLSTQPAPAADELAAAQEDDKTYGLTSDMLRFQAAAPAPDEATREFQAIGTIELSRNMNKDKDPSWVELLCLARQGLKYTVLPVMLQAADPGQVGDVEDVSLLVLNRSEGVELQAHTLREAFERDNGVLGAFTEAGLGVFVCLVFELG